MISKILVPTDFSDCATFGVDIAIDIANKANSEIHFMHIISTPIDWVKLPVHKEGIYHETKLKINLARGRLNKLVKRAKENGLSARHFIVYNKTYEEILNHVDNYNVDLVVMGSRGSRGLKNFTGSNAQKVVRSSTVPVLTVKDLSNGFQPEYIVFASTFTEDEGSSFKFTLNLAQILNSKIELLYINTPNNFKESDEIEARVDSFLKNNSEKSHPISIFNALNERRGILNFIASNNAGLVSMTTHAKQGLMKYFNPSIAENMVIHSSIPVLSTNYMYETKAP